jgi:hypothetical protein
MADKRRRREGDDVELESKISESSQMNEFVAAKQALMQRARTKIAGLIGILPTRYAQEREGAQNSLIEDLEALEDMIDSLIGVKTDAMVAAITARRAVESHSSNLPLCARCCRVMTITHEQLAQYIETIAEQMGRISISWPIEDFKARMWRVLEPGDEIVWLGIGYVNVRRVDGRVETIYQRAD